MAILVARPKSFVKILNFCFTDFDVSSYLKIEMILEIFWIFFLVGWSAGEVGWGSGWAALGSSWTEAGLKLGVGSSRTWLKLSWRSAGMGWAEAQAGLKLKLGLNIPGGRRGEVRKQKSDISRRVCRVMKWKFHQPKYVTPKELRGGDNFLKGDVCR